MVSINKFEPSILVEAVLLWTGWGHEKTPSRNDSLLVKHFGGELAQQLLPTIKDMEADFYSSDARHLASNLQEMGEMAAQQFRNKHPLIAEKIVEAFAWCYTFDFK